MADDLAARRAKLFGVSAASPDIVPLLSEITRAHSANAELSEELRETLKELSTLVREAPDNSELMACQAELASCRSQLMAEIDARARLDGELAAMKAEHERMEQMHEAPAQAAPVDPQEIARAVLAILPVAPAAVVQPKPKFLILETKDSMGNPRKVRVTPEY